MGYGNYSLDVARQARSTNRDAFTYAGVAHTASGEEIRGVHPLLDIKGQIRECMNRTPIVVALDVTRSRGNDSKIVYQKLPMFIGMIEMKGYVEGAAMSFAGIGDATAGDRAPVQISQFEADNRLDEALSSLWLEEGGGGTGQESYELIAYYYARKTKLECLNEGRKGFLFFVGDEGFYPKVSKHQIAAYIGDDVADDIDSKEIFAELQQKYHVFFIYPQKGFEDRKADIDAEIQQRVEAAGGQYRNVDVRASLIWNNRNDLDLHVIAPSGEEIYYAHKQSACKGWLDVDMNVQGETTKPVENVRWSEGEAPSGKYTVFVQNYRFHESPGPTPYRAEVEVGGVIKRFNGIIGGKGETGPDSNQLIFEFQFDPSMRNRAPVDETPADQYANYRDDVILAQWASVIPEEHILRIDDPHSILDVMLGALSLVGGANDLESFMGDLQGTEQTAARLAGTRKALAGLSAMPGVRSAARVSSDSIPKSEADKKRGGSSKRL